VNKVQTLNNCSNFSEIVLTFYVMPINCSVNSARIQNTTSSACTITLFAELFLTSTSCCTQCYIGSKRRWISRNKLSDLHIQSATLLSFHWNFSSRDKKQVFRIPFEYSDIETGNTFPGVNGCLNNSQSAMCVTLILLVTGFKVDRISLINYTLLRTHSANLTGTLVNVKLNNRNLKCLHYLYRS
jgi:hypothetical protein